MKIRATRTITFTTESDMDSYPGMTPQQAALYEKGLELSEVAELLAFVENIETSVEVEIID